MPPPLERDADRERCAHDIAVGGDVNSSFGEYKPLAKTVQSGFGLSVTEFAGAAMVHLWLSLLFLYRVMYNEVRGDSMKQDSAPLDDKAAALLRVASYLGRPQKFMPVADARAGMRRTLDLVSKGSVVLTMHGEPEAAVVPFTTLEDMRRALLHLLVEEMSSSLALSKERIQSQEVESVETSEEELEALVGDAIKKVRRRKSSRRASHK